MTSQVLERSHARIETGIIDCDIHPALKSPGEIDAFLPSRWRAHCARYGGLSYGPLQDALPYTRLSPNASRLDAFPPAGGPQGSDLAFMQAQHLDANGIALGILQPLGPNGSTERNVEYGAAICSAVNDWQAERWLHPEPRLRGSIVVQQEHPEAAVAEIEKRAADRRFVQVSLTPRTLEPLGRRRYWPIYEAAARAGLPVGVHVYAVGPHAFTGGGWPSFYIEEHYLPVHSMQAIATSMIMEGVFERFPALKLVLIEGSFSWAPSLGWRLDKLWARMRDEVPHVKRPPSEYLREHVWFTTQPIEEPERPDDMIQVLDWIGWDRILFSTDYPHWDFDDPRYAFKIRMNEAQKARIFRDNAKGVFRLS